jgi:hypothetical protein
MAQNLASRLIPLLLVFGLWSVAGSVQADVIGSAEIQSYYDDLDPAYKQDLGTKVGAVQATGSGAKQVFQRGAIYWRESTGALRIMEDFWVKYRAMGAETGVLGHPREELDWSGYASYQDFEYGALVEHSQRDGVFAVRGLLFEAWKKNDRARGPLGVPLEDSRITTSGGIFPLVTAAEQRFHGATIQWMRTRMLFDPASNGWDVVQLNVDNTVRIRVQMPATVVADTDGPDNPECSRNIDHTFWAHGRSGERYYLDLYGNWCGPSQGHQVRPTLTFEFSVLRLGNFEAMEVQWGLDARVPYLYGVRHPNVNDGPTFIGVLRGSEETLDLDDLVEGGVDTIPEPEFTDDSAFIERITIRNTQLQESDIRF